MSTVQISSADVRAEREAAALEWFAENLGQTEPLPRLRRERELRQMADEIGIDPPPHPRYPRGAAIRAWFRIIDAVATGKPLSSPRIDFAPSTRAARAKRSAAYRKERARCLRLQNAWESEVSIARAAALLGLSRSGAEKALYRGDIPHRKSGHRTVVPVDALHAFSRSRLKVAA